MTKKIITSYTAILCMSMALALVGATYAHASEVTGTLSSDASSNSGTSGNISGTVSSSGGGGSSSGGSRSIGGSRNSGNNLSNAPSGSVLGANTNNTIQSPGFPNAGFAPTEVNNAPTYWSAMIAFFRSIVSF